jgi:hypothetical protein
MTDVRQQAITGVIPPQQAEALIREAFPSVARNPGMANIGRTLTRTIILAPLAWLVMALGYFSKVLPFSACRYTLTNRRLMIRKGWSRKVTREISLEDIDDVRIQTDSNTTFFRAATLEIVSRDQVALKLPGTPEPDSFRIAILNACSAWVPGRASKAMPFIAASAK